MIAIAKYADGQEKLSFPSIPPGSFALTAILRFLRTFPPEEKKAARLILDFLLAEGLTGTCGCRAFYSPQERQERGEEYGHALLLILVYDSGDVVTCMDPALGQLDLVDRFEENLVRNGVVIETCMHWYSAIYEEKDYEPFDIRLNWPAS